MTMPDQGFEPADPNTVIGGTGPEVDNTPSENVPASTTVTQQEAVTPPADNPAWAPLLEDVPTEIAEMLKPRLAKQDEHFRSLQAKYKPFEQYDPQLVEQAVQVFNNINADPRKAYEVLGEALGITAQEAKQVVENAQEELETEEVNDPRLNQILEQQAQFQAFLEQQEQQKQVQALEQRIDAQIRDLTAKDPNVDIEDLLQRAALLSDQERDPITAAYKQQQAYNQRILARQQQPAKTPPLFVPSSNSATGGEVINTDTVEGRRQQAARLIEQMRNS